jgi:hypothetical protein
MVLLSFSHCFRFLFTAMFPLLTSKSILPAILLNWHLHSSRSHPPKDCRHLRSLAGSAISTFVCVALICENKSRSLSLFLQLNLKCSFSVLPCQHADSLKKLDHVRLHTPTNRHHLLLLAPLTLSTRINLMLSESIICSQLQMFARTERQTFASVLACL